MRDKKITKELNLEEEFPVEIKKEIMILYELGLEPYEIEYLIYLKTKEKARNHWGGRNSLFLFASPNTLSA